MISWMDFVSHVHATSHKLEKMAVFDSRGNPIAVTEGLEVTESVGRALLSCLGEGVLIRVRLTVDHITYTAFQVDAQTLIGWGEDRQELLVACRDGNGDGAEGERCLVLALSKAEAHGSCLFELRRFLTARRQRHPQPVQPLGPSHASHGGAGGPVTLDGESAHQPLVSLNQVAVEMD